MENATKALIIAGAILIAIVLISIGVNLISGAQGTINSGMSQMNEQEKSMFNSQFEGFEGIQMGTQIKTLLTRISTNNTSNSTVVGKVITIVYSGIPGVTDGTIEPTEPSEATDGGAANAGEIAALRAKINTGAQYTVTLGYGSNGLINSITIVGSTK